MFFETLSAICTIVVCVVECAKAVFSLLKELGVIETNAQSADELGAKVLAAEEQGITLETSKNFEDYKNQINAVEVPNPEKYSPEDKARKAIEYSIESINYKYGVNLSPDAAGNLANHIEYFNNGKLDYVMKNDSNLNNSLVEYGNYLDSKIVGQEADNIREKFIDIEQAVNPNISRQEAIDNIYKYKS